MALATADATPRDEIDEIILGLAREARDFTDNELSSHRERTWRYYNGEIDTTAKKGRSKVVKTEVRDTVELMMPSLMSILLSADDIVEYVQDPHYGETDEATKETIEANSIFFNENNGWLLLHDAVKESLIARSGVFKVYWDETVRYVEEELDPSDPMGREIAELGGAEIIDSMDDDDYSSDMDLPPSTTGLIARFQIQERKIKCEVVPAEELLIDRYAKDADSATIIGQESEVRLGDLVAMGFDPETVQDFKDADDEPANSSQESTARTGYNQTADTENAETRKHWALRKVTLREVYPLLDPEGDGTLQRYKCFIVNEKVLRREPVQFQPFIVFSSIRIPHTAIGRSPGEHSVEFQDEGSAVFRQVMDNLYWSNNPALQVVRNQANPYQIENWSFGTIIDVKMPNAVTPITIPFVGDKAIMVMEWLEKQREARTGAFKDAMGLNPKVLRGQTATAAEGAMSQATKQLEMYARVIAETGIVPLFKKFYELKTGKKPSMGMKVNVGLGNGSLQERMMALGILASKGELVVSTLGPDNPVCNLANLTYIYQKMADLAPYYDGAKIFGDPAAVAAEIAAKKQNPQPPPPDPKMIEAQAKAQAVQAKAQADIQAQQAKLAAEVQANQATLQANIQAKQAEAQAKMAQLQEEGANRIQIAQIQAQNDMDIAQMKAQSDIELARLELEYETRLEAAHITVKDKQGQGNINRSKGRATR